MENFGAQASAPARTLRRRDAARAFAIEQQVKNMDMHPIPDATPPARILVVDDSEDDAELLALQIEREIGPVRYTRVECASDMDRELARSDWDLVISDHSMPRFDSIGALEVLKRTGRDIPFVIYSGHLELDTGISAMHGGASDFVAKSTPQRLMAVIERELANGRLRRAKEAAEQSLVNLVNYDPLTRLPNRTLFAELMTLRLHASGGAGTLAFVDLDRFMRINDSFGYPTGDALIRQAGNRIVECAGPHDVVARLGQDKFAIFFVDARTDAEAAAAVERVMQRFGPPFIQNGQELYLTVSAGAAIAPAHGNEIATLLKNAESAMFAAKKAGRNTFQLYRTEINDGASRRLRLENDLRHAVERDQLFLMYQPILDMRTHAIIGAEALVRWRHPELGLVPPDQFIGLADESGLIVDIGDWVLRTACRQAAEWRRAGHPHFAIAVNVSPIEFRRQDIVERVADALRRTGLPPGALELEITETAAMQQAESTVETLRRLKDMGVHISIDDFGTGYSSLAYLKRFPIDILKVDRSFVRDMRTDSDDAAIVHTVVALARALKLRVHAEGVETEAQFDLLAAEECDRMQGYLLSKPLEAPHLLALLERRAEKPEPAQAAA